MALFNRNRTGTDLSKEQKVAFVLLMFLGFGGLILGFRSFGSNIRRPFDLQLSEFSRVGGTFEFDHEREAREVEEMKTRDTDEDGLNDYDETFVYRTSPYLADTDSDGRDDKTEVFAGGDPNCPVGRDCGRVLEAQVDAGVEIDAGPSNAATANVLFESFSAIPPEQVRELLVEAGVPKETLDELNDEQLMGLFRQSVIQAQESGELDRLVDELDQEDLEELVP